MPHEYGWLLTIFFVLVGFALLAKGAAWMVAGSVQIARRLGVTTLVIGLTVVAFGTSAPEIVVSARAADQGEPSISLGNVLGSNIANIGLVLGVCAIVLPAVLQQRLARREMLWLFASLAALWMITCDRTITRFEAGALLILFLIYNAHVFLTARRKRGQAVEELVEVVKELEEERLKRPGLWLALGIASILIGAEVALLGAKSAAVKLGIPPSVIGLTVIAVGTSLPELAAGLGGALKGETDISIGNVVGSNVFNLMAVIGIVGIIQPFDPRHPAVENPALLEDAMSQALGEDLWVVLAFSLAAVLLPVIAHGRRGRAKGVVLLLAYAGYTVWLFTSR